MKIRILIWCYALFLLLTNWQYTEHLHAGGANQWAITEYRLISGFFSLCALVFCKFELRRITKIYQKGQVSFPDLYIEKGHWYYFILLVPLAIPMTRVLSYNEKSIFVYTATTLEYGGGYSLPIIILAAIVMKDLLRIHHLNKHYKARKV